MHRARFCALFVIVSTMVLPSYSQTGNGAPSGAHYNLNIIGVENPKTSPLTSTDRHTIFVALGSKSTITSNIYLTQGDFQVCDGNAFDAAYDCAGKPDQGPGRCVSVALQHQCASRHNLRGGYRLGVL